MGMERPRALAGNPMLLAIIDPLLDAARELRDQLAILEKRVGTRTSGPPPVADR